MDLEPATNFVLPPRDKRPHIPAPPPVRVMAVEDVHLDAPAGLESPIDDFYVALLAFERDANEAGRIIFRAENVRLIFAVREPPVPRDDLRPIGIEVPSLGFVEAKIIEREIEYQRLRGLLVAQESLLLQDPAGNWISITESRGVR